jgi:4-hydroxybenzoate polyprenyltransferase
LFKAMRPKQWAKNVMLFAALVFSVNQFWAPAELPTAMALAWRSVLAFLCFCLISSGQYLFNDVVDAPRDRLHPQKRHRPIASGRVSPALALSCAAALLAAGLAGAYLLAPVFAAACLLYLALMFAYSVSLKHVPIVDVFIIAAGFVIRAAAGALVIGVPISPWLYLCTMLGALFLALTKRRQELVLLDDQAAAHRGNLGQYSPTVLDQMINVVTSSTVIAYSVYTFTAASLPSNHAMMLTIPFVLYGIFRYLLLVHERGMGGAPEEVLYTDKPLLIDIVAWVAVSAVILYVFRE